MSSFGIDIPDYPDSGLNPLLEMLQREAREIAIPAFGKPIAIVVKCNAQRRGNAVHPGENPRLRKGVDCIQGDSSLKDQAPIAVNCIDEAAGQKFCVANCYFPLCFS